MLLVLLLVVLALVLLLLLLLLVPAGPAAEAVLLLVLLLVAAGAGYHSQHIASSIFDLLKIIWQNLSSAWTCACHFSCGMLRSMFAI